MDREELQALIRKGPVKITMNDGQVFEIPTSDFCIVSDISAALLRKCEDGKWRTIHLPLVTMTSVELLTAEAS